MLSLDFLLLYGFFDVGAGGGLCHVSAQFAFFADGFKDRELIIRSAAHLTKTGNFDIIYELNNRLIMNDCDTVLRDCRAVMLGITFFSDKDIFEI